MRKENLFFRILIIEDNPDRIKILKSWLPEDVKIVVATSAGRALGVELLSNLVYGQLIQAAA